MNNKITDEDFAKLVRGEAVSVRMANANANFNDSDRQVWWVTIQLEDSDLERLRWHIEGALYESLCGKERP